MPKLSEVLQDVQDKLADAMNAVPPAGLTIGDCMYIGNRLHNQMRANSQTLQLVENRKAYRDYEVK